MLKIINFNFLAAFTSLIIIFKKKLRALKVVFNLRTEKTIKLITLIMINC